MHYYNIHYTYFYAGWTWGEVHTVIEDIKVSYLHLNSIFALSHMYKFWHYYYTFHEKKQICNMLISVSIVYVHGCSIKHMFQTKRHTLYHHFQVSEIQIGQQVPLHAIVTLQWSYNQQEIMTTNHLTSQYKVLTRAMAHHTKSRKEGPVVIVHRVIKMEKPWIK